MNKINKSVTHIPKGGMCAVCKKSLNYCGDLEFDKMPVIETCKMTGVKIVKCSEFRRM